jgi:hypothetical protein
MLTEEAANRFAAEWLEGWNSHDVRRILQHYADDIEFVSPFVVKLFGNADGTIHGKADLEKYFAKGLSAYPDLNFHHYKTLVGVKSFTICYESVNNLLAAEVMELDAQGKIIRVSAHYTENKVA